MSPLERFNALPPAEQAVFGRLIVAHAMNMTHISERTPVPLTMRASDLLDTCNIFLANREKEMEDLADQSAILHGGN